MRPDGSSVRPHLPSGPVSPGTVRERDTCSRLGEWVSGPRDGVRRHAGVRAGTIRHRPVWLVGCKRPSAAASRSRAETHGREYPLASHHCLLSSPAKIVCQDGEIKVARKRETSEEVGKQFGW